MRINTYKTMLEPDTRKLCVVKEKSCNYSKESRLDKPEKVIRMLNEVYHLNLQSEEYLYMLCFDNKMKILGIFEVSHGSIRNSYAGTREIFIKALLTNCSNIILVHNHVSGETEPSRADYKVCEEVKEAGALLGITLMDFMIIGKNDFDYLSFKCEELM
ncbi:MAG: JAB domain-containing protein [Lachnospiraceae bacterium]|nr:JAB domain-containing protein [Lachnospiraceae bacterium]